MNVVTIQPAGGCRQDEVGFSLLQFVSLQNGGVLLAELPLGNELEIVGKEVEQAGAGAVFQRRGHSPLAGRQPVTATHPIHGTEIGRRLFGGSESFPVANVSTVIAWRTLCFDRSSPRIAALAHEAGLGYQLGCHPGESGVLSAAGRHWATSVRNIRYCEGSYDRYLLRDMITDEDITFGYGGLGPSLSSPGLGVTVNPRELQRLASHSLSRQLG